MTLVVAFVVVLLLTTDRSPSRQSSNAGVPTVPQQDHAGGLFPSTDTLSAPPPAHGTVGMNLGGAADAGFGRMPPDQQRSVMADLSHAGATWLRINVPFNGEMDEGGHFNWYTTPEITQAVSHSINVVALLSYPPTWAKNPDGSANTQSFASFAAAAASHLAPLGVHTFEIWNEPNLKGNWGKKVSPSGYGTLLKASSSAIKHVLPTSTVLSAGLAPAVTDAAGTAMSPVTFLTALYADGIGPYIDGVADHPYSYPDLPNAPDHWNQFQRLPEIHKLMADHGDGAKLIWLTEYGAPTRGKNAVATTKQWGMIAQAIDDSRTWSWLGPVFIFDWQDNQIDGSFGITDSAGRPKAAHEALGNLAPPSPR